MNNVILVIDDDIVLRDALGHGLRDNGFDVLTAESGEVACDILSRVRVDAIVLDRMMTGVDGLSFLKNFRAAGNKTPVIMLTAMGGVDNTIDGLAGGADDYMAKPFQLKELVLRLNNVIRRNENSGTIDLPVGLLRINDEFWVQDAVGTKLLTLSGEESRLLNALVSPIGNVVPAMPMVAKRLRNKLNGVLCDTDIMTVRGRGYKLVTKSDKV